MRHGFGIVLAVFVAASCGGSGGEVSDTTSDRRGADAVELTGADAAETTGQQDAAPDARREPVVPVPTDPLPVADAGTYSWGDGKNKLLLAYNDGKVFVLESSFGCLGQTGCKTRNEFLKITCNKAFEKGYVANVVDGLFVLDGIKGTDRLTGAVSSSQSFSLLYELTPAVSCCSDWFAFSAPWTGKSDCSDYRVPDCDVYNDANCSEGMNCFYGVGDKPLCRVAGDVPVGGACSNQASCSDGVCMMLQTDEEQHCYKYCKSATDCGTSKCLELTGHQWKVCSLPEDQFEVCNLLAQDCDDSGDGCYWSSSTISKPVCLPAGEAQKGEACGKSNDCAKGLDCIAGKKCHKICNTDKGKEPVCDDVFTGCSTHYPPQDAGYCGE